MPVASNFPSLIKEIKAQKFSPVYLLHGEEPFFIDQLVTAFEEHVVPPELRSFNQQILYGRDVNAGLIVDEASRYPMMAERQLVLIKEAYDITDIAALADFLKKPAPTTVLVFVFRGKKMKANTKVYKAILHSGVVYESKSLYDNQIPSFISGEFRSRGVKAEPGVIEMLAANLGTDLVVLNGAVDKLLLNVEEGKPVTAKDVETHVGISRQYNLFEFQDAIGNKQLERILIIGEALSRNDRELPTIVIVASLYGFFAAMLAIKDVINHSEADQKAATGIHSAFRLKKIRFAANRWSKPQLMKAILLLEKFDLRCKGVNYTMPQGGFSALTLELSQRFIALAVSG